MAKVKHELVDLVLDAVRSLCVDKLVAAAPHFIIYSHSKLID